MYSRGSRVADARVRTVHIQPHWDWRHCSVSKGASWVWDNSSHCTLTDHRDSSSVNPHIIHFLPLCRRIEHPQESINYHPLFRGHLLQPVQHHPTLALFPNMDVVLILSLSILLVLHLINVQLAPTHRQPRNHTPSAIPIQNQCTLWTFQIVHHWTIQAQLQQLRTPFYSPITTPDFRLQSFYFSNFKSMSLANQSPGSYPLEMESYCNHQIPT